MQVNASCCWDSRGMFCEDPWIDLLVPVKVSAHGFRKCPRMATVARQKRAWVGIFSNL